MTHCSPSSARNAMCEYLLIQMSHESNAECGTRKPLIVCLCYATQASMAGELRDVHSQRVAVMDAVCELLSDIPAAKINTMFGVSADHIQRKLAIR